MRFVNKLLFLCCLWLSATNGAEINPDPTEAILAERLSALGCRVELVLADSKVWVDYVYGAGEISQDGMTAPLSEEVFSCLNALHRLRKLRLDVKGGEVERHRLKALAELRSLRELELFGRDVNDEVMLYIGSLTNLESLRIWDAPISEQGLGQLSNMKALKRLDIGSLKSISRRGTEAVAKLTRLEEVRIYGQVEQGSLSPLQVLPRLQTVALGGPDVNRMLAELEMLPQIQTVNIAQAQLDGRSAEHLRDIKRLKVLKLECCVVSSEAVQVLKSLKLRRIECIRINSDVLAELAKGMSECIGNLEVAK